MRPTHWALLALLVPVGTTAQSLDPAAIAEINAATRARLRLQGGGQGVIQKATATPTTIGFERGDFLTAGGNPLRPTQPVPLAEITQIQVSRGTGALTGFKIGAGLGAALALIAVAVVNTGDEDFVALTSGEAAAAIVVWTGIGGGLGALIGSQSTRWHTVYQASRP